MVAGGDTAIFTAEQGSFFTKESVTEHVLAKDSKSPVS